MAAYTQSLVFVAATAAEFAAMQAHVAAVLPMLTGYTIVWKPSQKTLTLTATGTRVVWTL